MVKKKKEKILKILKFLKIFFLPIFNYVGYVELRGRGGGGVIWKTKKMTKPAKFSPRYYLRPRNLPCDGIDSVIGGHIRPFDIENCNSQQTSLEGVYHVSKCFCQCLGLAIVQKYSAHITVKGEGFYLNAYISKENLFHRVQDIHCKYFSLLYILFSI